MTTESVVKKIWFFDIQDKNLPVIVSYVLWSYLYPVANDMCHTFTLEDLEEQLEDEDEYEVSSDWVINFNEHAANPKQYICLNSKSQEEFMTRTKVPTLREGFEEFKLWLNAQGVADTDDFVVRMWW